MYMVNNSPSDVLTNVLRFISRSDIIILLLPIIQDLMDYFVLMLGRRLRHWTNIKPSLGQRLVFAGNVLCVIVLCLTEHVGLMLAHHL